MQEVAYAYCYKESRGAAKTRLPGRVNSPGQTADTRVVANQTCTEYRGAHTNENERVAVSACVSRNAPGTSEVVAFDEKLSGEWGSKVKCRERGLENPPA